MIRSATTADLPRLLEMGRAFFSESGYAAETSFDEESTEATFCNLINSDDGALLVGEVDGSLVGMAGALAYPFYFNANHKTGQELFWWVEPSRRGGTVGARLLIELEAWAVKRGCGTFSMVALASIDGPAAGIYSRRGYRPSECSYMKAV